MIVRGKNYNYTLKMTHSQLKFFQQFFFSSGQLLVYLDNVAGKKFTSITNEITENKVLERNVIK